MAICIMLGKGRRHTSTEMCTPVDGTGANGVALAATLNPTAMRANHSCMMPVHWWKGARAWYVYQLFSRLQDAHLRHSGNMTDQGFPALKMIFCLNFCLF